MKYLLLAYVEPARRDQSAVETAQSDPLQTVMDATSVTILDGLLSLSAPQSGKSLVGYCIVEARDLNDAIRVASKMPEALIGRIEIWPVRIEKEEQIERPI